MCEMPSERSADLRDDILRMVVGQDDTTISEARDALSFALIEYDSMSRKMTAKMPVRSLAAKE